MAKKTVKPKTQPKVRPVPRSPQASQPCEFVYQRGDVVVARPIKTEKRDQDPEH